MYVNSINRFNMFISYFNMYHQFFVKKKKKENIHHQFYFFCLNFYTNASDGIFVLEF